MIVTVRFNCRGFHSHLNALRSFSMTLDWALILLLSVCYMTSVLPWSFIGIQKSGVSSFCLRAPCVSYHLQFICNFSSLGKFIAMNQPEIDILTLTASDARALLDAKRIMSTQLVQVCLDQIQRHNKAGLKLNAVLLTAPQEDLMRKASVLDDERARGHVRSPLHGLPILLKVRESRA